MRSIPPEAYRLRRDGRKWRRLCEARRALAMQLASYADGDGSHITVGVERIRRELGWSNGWVFRILADLHELKLLQKDGLEGERGTARRRLDVTTFRQNSVGPLAQESTVREQNSAIGVQESTIRVEQKSAIERQDSTLRVETTVTRPTNTKPPLPPASAGNSTEQSFSWCRETVAVQMGRRRRLPNCHAYVGGSAAMVVEFLNRKGFSARIVDPSELRLKNSAFEEGPRKAGRNRLKTG